MIKATESSLKILKHTNKPLTNSEHDLLDIQYDKIEKIKSEIDDIEVKMLKLKNSKINCELCKSPMVFEYSEVLEVFLLGSRFKDSSGNTHDHNCNTQHYMCLNNGCNHKIKQRGHAKCPVSLCEWNVGYESCSSLKLQLNKD